MHFSLPKIYPITDEHLSGISHADQIREFAAGGARFAQIREKQLAPRAFFEGAEVALGVARKAGLRIIINDRVDFALALRADGVHLGRDDLPPARAREILGREAIIGYSTHSLEQAVEALKHPIDYIAIGPIFATRSKSDHAPIIGLEGLRAARAAIGRFPLVAIGGIDRGNLQAVFDAGADTAAIIGDLLRHPMWISESMRELLRIAGQTSS